jgi:hypothetical protein
LVNIWEHQYVQHAQLDVKHASEEDLMEQATEINAYLALVLTIWQLAAHAVLLQHVLVDKLQESTITVLRAICPAQHVLHLHQTA